MNIDAAIRRAQVYGFLSNAFLYPTENWTEDAPLLAQALADLNLSQIGLSVYRVELPALQTAYRHTFGATGSLCYETEYGLPHEFGQSQEMADINGFYRAFGFTLGGPVRERSDHLAVELEFMHVLALKEAHALNQGVAEHAEICVEAQHKFLQDHLGRWIDLFAQSLALNTHEDVYLALAHLAAAFIKADAARLGIALEQQSLDTVPHTPFDPDFSCAACPLVSKQ